MSPRDYFNMNGVFPDSPLIRALSRIDEAFKESGAVYAVIGGLAVARNGAPRSTCDIDILTRRSSWMATRTALEARGFTTSIDSAEDGATGIPVDILFAGDDWDLPFPMPDPESVSEFDESIGARFIKLVDLIELKTAVYLSKKAKDGLEFAAKDLSDVVELLRANRAQLEREGFGVLRGEIKAEVARLFEKVLRKQGER